MRVLITGDWHFPKKKPTCRIDDYLVTWKRKVEYMMGFIQEYEVDVLLQPGDLTNTPFLDYSEFLDLYDFLLNHISPIYTIYGQHDLRYRNKGNTPLDALEAMGLINIGTNKGVAGFVNMENVFLYSCSYEEKIPVIETEGFNILLIHKMIIPKVQADWQKDYSIGTDFLSKNGFDLIISGDNHQSFMEQDGNRYLFNCGSLMRSRTDQIDHEPCFYIFDTEDCSYEKFLIPVDPWQQCFDLSAKVEKMENNEEMKAYVAGLAKHKNMGMNCKDAFSNFFKKNKTDQSIIDIINNSMGAKKK
jgi:DNA repair exonuclease SbcCD nuclease subunit